MNLKMVLVWCSWGGGCGGGEGSYQNMEKGILLLTESKNNFNQTLCRISMTELVFNTSC